METLGIYVQVPFCSSKCTFCNFSSRVAPTAVICDYVRSLQQEILLMQRGTALDSRLCGNDGGTVVSEPGESLGDEGQFMNCPYHLWELPVDTVYVGGGTPTLLGREGLERVSTALRRHFGFADDLEITLEMTPGSADAELLAACRALGVNRLSVGAQSFDDQELASVGRLHSAEGTAEQIRLARAAGHQNISLDLIASLPHQTSASWDHSLQQALALAPEHFSIYLFEVDENSRLGAEVLRHGTRYHAEIVPDEDFAAEAYERARELLAKEGYIQYEISNFARAGFESRHNRKYWQRGPYLGLGAGAHSFDGRSRWANETSPEAYAARIAHGELPIADWRTLAQAEELEEFFFLGLRQREGIDLDVAFERWGPPALARWNSRIATLVRDGWLETEGSRLRLAPQAYLVSNEIFQEFV